MLRRIVALIVALVLLCPTALPRPVMAQVAPFCAPGQRPAFEGDFVSLEQTLLELMGEPIECEHEDPQTGKRLQRTTTGEAYYEPLTGTPTFHDGRQWWAQTPKGTAYWTREQIGETVIPYIGTWSRHGLSVFIREDGEMTMVWRTYQWCGPNVTPPCDTIDDEGVITAGGYDSGVFHTFQLPTAYGTLDRPYGATDADVSITLLAYGMAELTTAASPAIVLCGPRFFDLAPPSVLAEYPCGA